MVEECGVWNLDVTTVREVILINVYHMEEE